MQVHARLTALASLLAVACTPSLPAGWTFAPLPGAPAMEPAELRQLAEAWEHRPSTYTFEARQRQADGMPRYLNRLFLAGSAYLALHAHNPVDWRPWGPQALAEAKRSGRPILLSVGYATCHWCHVMAQESFEDEAIAAFINAHFVAVKVDREELPDVDAMAAAALRSLGVGGGWPTTLWLTPDGAPFVGGTYYPPRDADGQPGLLTLLHAVAEGARQDPARMRSTAQALMAAMRAPPPASSAGSAASTLQRGLGQARAAYDAVQGGLRGPRKFPGALPARALLREYRRTHDASALTMVGQTLQHMDAGGIHDLLGGGFHRYTVDAQWQVPHFEKMLYDNAQLLMVYLEAFQASGVDEFAEVARDIAQALLRDFGAPGGGLLAGLDADSRDPAGALREGVYYTWTAQELQQALGPDAPAARRLLGWQEPAPMQGGRHVLTLPLGGPQDGNDAASLRELRARLFAARQARPAPRGDDLVITAWNGLAVDALANAARILQDPNLLTAASELGEFVLRQLRPAGHLIHSLRRGVVGPPAYLEDSAAALGATISLYEATGRLRWLDAAVELEAEAWAQHGAGASVPRAGLEVVPLPDGDVPTPAGLSQQALGVLRLYEITEESRHSEHAQALLAQLLPLAQPRPIAWPTAMLALDWLQGARQVCLVAPHQRDELQPLVRAMARAFAPAQVVHLAVENDAAAQDRIPALRGKVALGGRPTAYVCKNHVCALPVTDPNLLVSQLLE